MLCNKVIGGGTTKTSFPSEWNYFRSLANENESAFLIASGGIDTIAFSGAEEFVMKVYGGIDGTQLLYTINSGSSKKVDLWNSDLENYPLPTGLVFSKLQGKPYSDEKIGDVELFTVVTSKTDGNPVCVAVAETEYSKLGLPYYRVLACDLNIPKSPAIRGCVRNALDLEFVFFKKGMTAIPGYAFYNSGLRECEIPDNITYLDSSVFYGTPIEKIDIPDSVTNLGEYLFAQCTWLKDVHLPTGANTISVGMFSECTSLNKINIPQTYKRIFENSFSGCKSLKEISFPDGITDFFPANTLSSCDVLDRFELNASSARVVDGTNMLANCPQLRYIHMPNIRLKSFGCPGQSANVKNKIGYADRGDRPAIVLDWVNFNTSSTITTIWNTSYTQLTENDYLTIFRNFYENGKVFTNKNLIITGSDGATDTVRNYITDMLGGVCVG